MVGKKIPCWNEKCGKKMTVIGFLAVHTDCEELDGEPCMLSDVTELPEALVSYAQSRVPNFKLQYSRMVQDHYYGCSCPSCGRLYGDFYLFSEPGIAFFPNSEEDAQALYLTELPLEGEIEVDAGYSCGTADMVLAYAKRIS